MANIYVEKKELIYLQSMKSFWSALTTQDWPRLSHIHFPKSSALNNGLTCLVHLRITCLNLISVPTFWSRPQAKELLRLKQQIQIKIFDKYANSTDLGHELKIYTTKIHCAVCVNDHHDTHVWNM